MRVALLVNILSPYRVPVHRALAATPGWTLRLLLSAESEFDRRWRVDAPDLDVEVVRGWSFRRRARSGAASGDPQLVTLHVPFGTLGALRRFAPDVVISGELGVRTLLAWIYCALFRVPLVIWTYHSRASAEAAGPLRRALWRALLARAQAVVGMGRQAREVIASLGVPAERIFDAPNACDVASLERALARLDPDRPAALRRALGCRGRVALVAGRLAPVKGIEPLLRAWQRLPEALRRHWTLLFVGSGPLEPAVRAAQRVAEPGEIALSPEVEPSALAGFYTAADLLVFPTLADTWGLVVNEAFACGLPVLCSRRAGCADDLVRPGENGWLFDPRDAEAFTRALAQALESGERQRLGARARQTAARYRPEAMADGLRRAAEQCRARTAGPSRFRRGSAALLRRGP